jgi:outer membrane protein assembly factor BamA
MIFGYIENLDSNNILPSAYKFQIGGQTSLRGWSGPKDFNISNGSVIDIMNIEYRFPLIKKIGAEIFFDTGRLYETINNFTSLKHSWNYGFGIVYQSTLGPIRLDAGFPYGEITNPKLHASLLYMF